MKDTESEFLNNLFIGASEHDDESEVNFPLVDVPTGLTDNLYAIAEPAVGSVALIRKRRFGSWPKLTSIAASLLVVVVLFQVYQQQQTLKQLKQAQSDLATALHYLGKANRITRAQALNALNTNMKKAAIGPVAEIGRDTVLPNLKPLEPEANNRNRAL